MKGKVWKLGDNINTDVLAPGYAISLPLKELAMHCLEGVIPQFSKNVKKGDIVIAGENLGIGSSREQAASVLKELGIVAVFAQSFARIFYRNAVNNGIPAYIFKEVDEFEEGDEIEFDMTENKLVHFSKNKTYSLSPMPPFLSEIIEQGGIIGMLKNRQKGEKK